MQSSDFRRSFASLTAAALVTSNGRTLGKWTPGEAAVPAACARLHAEDVPVTDSDEAAYFLRGRVTTLQEEVAQLKKLLAARSGGLPPMAPEARFNSRPFTPVPK